VLLFSAPAFAHGGGMGHMGSSPMSNMGSVTHQTATGDHDGDHHESKNWQYTTKSTDKTEKTDDINKTYDTKTDTTHKTEKT
jgi:hypothetical protein